LSAFRSVAVEFANDAEDDDGERADDLFSAFDLSILARSGADEGDL